MREKLSANESVDLDNKKFVNEVAEIECWWQWSALENQNTTLGKSPSSHKLSKVISYFWKNYVSMRINRWLIEKVD